MWPKGEVDASYYEPVVSDVPALVLSGDLDPVTPPSWGDAVVKSLSHGRHVTVPATGHGVISTACGMKLIQDFLDSASSASLDASCVRSVKRPPFFVTPAGPDPPPATLREPGARAWARPGGRGRPMIRVEQLRKQFGTVTAVNGVSFTAENGAITGLLGPNGAGKTTTLRMLYAVMRPDSGSIRVDDVDAIAEPQEAQGRLGVLPDGFGLYPRLTAREHLEYFGELHGIAGPQLRQRTRELLDLLDMNAIADRRTAGFSHGERTKVALARALVHSPQNVLLDEPTNGLDVMSTRAVRNDRPPAQGRGPLRRVLESRHAGSLGAVRLDRRHRARGRSSHAGRRTIFAGTPATTTWKTRSWRWPASSGERANDVRPQPASDRHRHAQGDQGLAARSARTVVGGLQRVDRTADHRVHDEPRRRSTAGGRAGTGARGRDAVCAGARRVAAAAVGRGGGRGSDRSRRSGAQSGRRARDHHPEELRREIQPVAPGAAADRGGQLAERRPADGRTRAPPASAVQRGDRQPPSHRARRQSGRRQADRRSRTSKSRPRSSGRRRS